MMNNVTVINNAQPPEAPKAAEVETKAVEQTKIDVEPSKPEKETLAPPSRQGSEKTCWILLAAMIILLIVFFIFLFA